MDDLTNLPEEEAPVQSAAAAVSEAVPPFRKDAVLADLRVWFGTWCRNSPISRDTRALNAITASVAAIEAAVRALKE